MRDLMPAVFRKNFYRLRDYLHFNSCWGQITRFRRETNHSKVPGTGGSSAQADGSADRHGLKPIWAPKPGPRSFKFFSG